VEPDDALIVSLTYAGGEVTGDIDRVEVPLGTNVRLTLTSDVVDEVHVHGYELTTAVPAGQAAQVEFLADQPGVFEVELHDARKVLTRLQVS
jgi:heme/copper-type cytochrome/quinol oxidase subunit 2